MLYASWKDGQLNQDVRRRLVQLSNALQESDLERAEAIQISLAVDYTSECSGWILAVKSIIHQLKCQQHS